MNPFVSVVVVVRNESTYIRECIESLFNLNYPKKQYEILVIDGMSTDGTERIVQTMSEKVKEPRLTLIPNERKWIAPGRNLGLEKAKGEYVAFTDGDCVADRNWLMVLSQELKNSSDDIVATGGPNLIPAADPVLSKIVGLVQETMMGSGGSPQSYRIRAKKYVESIPTCNILYRREAVRQEKFDESFNVGEDCVGEDADLNFRLREKGYKLLYLPDAIVWHHRTTGLTKFAKKMFLYGQAMAKVIKKHRKTVRWYAFLPSLFVLAIVFMYPAIVFIPVLKLAYFAGFVVYLLSCAILTTQIYKKLRTTKVLVVPIMVLEQHVSYGLGFIRGLLR